jgi:hypothetical protein
MKTIITLCLAFAVTMAGAQGVKEQPKDTAPKVQQSTTDSVVIKGTYRNDTTRVVAVLFVGNGSLAWIKGYVVVKSFVPQGSQPLTTSQVLYDEKGNLIKPEDVYDLKQLNK